ncbi:MAG: hypothetical protein ACP5J6_01600 [Candidatus Saccharicenans sp.]
MIQKTIGLIAILSIFPAYIADSLLFVYLLVPERGTAWVETAFFTTLIMLLIGLITLFEWEVIFLDRQDYSNLGPLPVRPLTVFSAKFISLIMFIGMFAVGINSLSSIVFAMYLGQSRGYGLASAAMLLLVHLVVMLAAGSFIFFALALVFGLFNILLRAKIFQRLSEIIRLGLIVAHIFIIYFFVLDTTWIFKKFKDIQALKENPTTFMMNFPPLWFTGLYRVLMGSREVFFKKLAYKAVLALTIVIAAYFFITLVSYSRYLRKVLPEGKKHLWPSMLRRIAEPVLNLTILRNQVERAVFWFYHGVFSRSRMHRNRIMSYLGVGLGLTMIMLTATGKYFWKYQSGNMLSLPLVLTFFLLINIKDASSLPVNWSANWVFVTSEGPGKWPYFSAFRKVVFLFYLLPLYLSLFVFYSFLWGWRKSGLHCLYDLVFAVFFDGNTFLPAAQISFCLFLPAREKPAA